MTRHYRRHDLEPAPLGRGAAVCRRDGLAGLARSAPAPWRWRPGFRRCRACAVCGGGRGAAGRGGGGGGPASGAAARVLSAVAVGPQQRVVTVEVGPEHARTWLVLGVTARQVSCLHVLPVPPQGNANENAND